ncbi:class D beta-lactamase [Phragmitibacter flavus]|uniref:Beta-lactamase n=1 Tax=Phragmitibacter flavus TaxID=2576071 RepID=A0A5R8KB05_9BACT|nr:class D beta-lactamase [Phragmitibacter flavus]TLD69481.1 class D beta-lactamase [Phragmitibacter flavus]
MRNPWWSFGVFVFVCSSGWAEDALVERAEWGRFFEEAKAEGTVVVLDERGEGGGASGVYDGERAKKRLTPASTFKIPHTLFALDAGVVRDEFQVFEWDGEQRPIETWNRDQDLRSSMRNSVVWVYEKFAREIGDEAEIEYLKKVGYGNEEVTGMKPFWVEGDLAISAVEQVAFLKRLYRNELPFKVEHQRLVKDVMIVEAGRDWILRAKTGWSGEIGGGVGWVEWPTGPGFFALNIDTPGRMEDLPKREGITRAVLREVGALP